MTPLSLKIYVLVKKVHMPETDVYHSFAVYRRSDSEFIILAVACFTKYSGN